MKRILFSFGLLLLVFTVRSQYSEFKTYNNGLIYSESTMHRLGDIVDSLNVKFRACDLSHPYYSFPQGIGIFVSIPSKEVQKLIEDDISFADFASRFQKNVKGKEWIVKSRYLNYDKKKQIEYAALPYGWNQEASLVVKDKRSNDKMTGWIVSEDGLEALYLEKLEAIELPYAYARHVQYVDCMIDTTAQIYFPQAEARTYQKVEKNSKAEQFIEWANKFPNAPKEPDYEKTSDDDFQEVYAAYAKKYEAWDSLRLLNLDIKIQTAHYWKGVLMEARDEALASANSDGRIEFYVARYLSKEDALQMKRGRKVMGYCSQDLSPRYHAIEICQLAAETAQWDIFLRSHLDVMNDRFERQSDGSYAYAGRKTYLKELEELDIEATDLLLGTCLRTQNVGTNHYWGSISRVGRALADTEDKTKLEEQMLAMMQDTSLDLYNRLLLLYTFDHYTHNLDDEVRRSVNVAKLKEVVSGMPSYVKDIWRKE